jgi:hypothetical protein
LAGGQLFTTLDLSHAYNQLLLDEDSRKYVTINTHKGLYQYTRLPFGIASAPAVFQRTMDTILQGVEDVACYIDDIIIMGKTLAEHMERLEVRSFLGLINYYYGKFIPNTATILSPLLRKDVKWNWTSACSKVSTTPRRH